jgi:superfamily II DNA or RNA helicase
LLVIFYYNTNNAIMSVCSPINSLTDDEKQLILDTSFDYVKGGTFGGRQGIKKRIDPYLVDEETLVVYTPFYFSTKTLNRKPPPRESYKNINPVFTGKLRDYQVEIIPSLKRALDTNKCALLNLHVGFGKTIVAIYTSTVLKLVTLIITPKLVLVDQWMEGIREFTDGTAEFLKPAAKSVNYDAQYYIINAINIRKMEAVLKKLRIGTLIVDELHLVCAEKSFTNLFYLTPRYVLSLSATSYRPDNLDKLIKLYFGENTINKKLYRPHIVYKIQTGLELDFRYQHDGTMDWNSLLMSQADHIQRNQIIIDIILKHPERNFLVLCKRLSQGNYLVDRLQELGESVTHMLTSKRKGEEAFDTESRILIATGQKCSTGFSHNKLNTLIMAADVEEYFIQYLGRVFRTVDVEPVVFDLVDEHPTLKRHFTSRRKVYQESGGVIKNYS